MTDTSSYRLLDYDPIPDHQIIVSWSIHNLITQETSHPQPPASLFRNPELLSFISFPKSTNLTAPVDPFLLYIDETKRRLGDRSAEHLCSVRYNQQHLPVANRFNSHSLGDMSILGLLQCHNDATCK
eukprot:g42657.t1